MIMSFFSKCRAVVPIAIVAGILSATFQAAQAETAQKAFTVYDAAAKELLSRMTLDEKIGQMCQPDQTALKDPADIEKLLLRLCS